MSTSAVAKLKHSLLTKYEAISSINGQEIIKQGRSFIDFLKQEVPKDYTQISEGGEEIQIRYKNKDFNADTLGARRDHEIRYAQTQIGPHRDDLEFFIDGKAISESASRGEYRTLLLSMKLAEIAYIKKTVGEMPILLLDDVFSELDPDRQKHLLSAISNCQAIITTTDVDSHPEIEGSAVLEV